MVVKATEKLPRPGGRASVYQGLRGSTYGEWVAGPREGAGGAGTADIT